MDLALKVYDVNYQFILDNYLDRSLWNKSWTVFEYKRFKIEMELYSIQTYNRSLYLRFKITDENMNYETTIISVYLDNFNMKVFDKQVKGCIFELVQSMEKNNYIIKSAEYKKIENTRDEEKDTLTTIAEEFLDDNNVSNDDIREVYIDNYISRNSKIPGLLYRYRESNQYKFLTELYLVVTKLMDDDTRYKQVKDAIGETKTKQILDEYSEYNEYFSSDNYTNDMNNLLEGI